MTPVFTPPPLEEDLVEEDDVATLLENHERLVYSRDGVPLALPSADVGRVIADVQDVLEDTPLEISSVHAGRRLPGTREDGEELRIELTITERHDQPEVEVA